MIRTAFSVVLIAVASTSAAQVQTSAGSVSVSPVLSGLDAPWGFGFLPSGEVVLTEKRGRARDRVC